MSENKWLFLTYGDYVKMNTREFCPFSSFNYKLKRQPDVSLSLLGKDILGSELSVAFYTGPESKVPTTVCNRAVSSGPVTRVRSKSSGLRTMEEF